MIVLTRARGSAWEPKPLEWRPVTRSNGPLTATVTCSNNHDGLIGEHDIAGDGTVTPSVECTVDECGWHEHIKLEGWEA